MKTEQLAALFVGIETCRQSQSEATFLSIGGRGYYENPASDLLRFFLIPRNAHELGTLFLEALLEVTGVSVPKSSLPTVEVQREVHTVSGNRIDLLLKADGWLMLIENKIWHEQINPFEDYEALAKQRMSTGDQDYYVVLSPGGESTQVGWQGLSYRRLIDALKVRLDECASDLKARKWWFFAQDFILHLEQELYAQAMTPEEIKFVEENQPMLAAAAQLQQRYRAHLMAELPRQIDAHCHESGASSTDEGWGIRLRYPLWGTASIVWWNNALDRDRIMLSVYLESPSTVQWEEARKSFEGAHRMNPGSAGRFQTWVSSSSFDSRPVAEERLRDLSVGLLAICGKTLG